MGVTALESSCILCSKAAGPMAHLFATFTSGVLLLKGAFSCWHLNRILV